MKLESNIKRPSRCLARIVRLFAARCGYVLLPISEIERMESDAESYYVAMKRKPYVTKSAKAYFNGVADYSSKSAHRLREKYLPNKELTD
jgi:hypothetical protein